MKALGLNWTIGSNFGWGTYGLELALHLFRRGTPTPVLLQEPAQLATDELQSARLDLVLRLSRDALAGTGPVSLSAPGNGLVVAHAIGNNGERAFAAETVPYRAEREVALAFVENTVCSSAGRQRYASYPLTVAGSRWCGEVLRQLGAPAVVDCIQGIDPATFHPAPRRGDFSRRFVVFSGGKLEFRKGQDLVLAAFGAFRSRHPEALLLAVWGNQWTRSTGLGHFRHSVHVSGPPARLDGGGVDWKHWLGSAGISRDDVLMIPQVAHDRLGVLMREADVALFPNRAEGGTNLVAMEAMACGVPTILSANTGHLDIVAEGACIPLRRQRPVVVDDRYLGTGGWGESDVEEMVEALETVWRDRERARAIGAAGAEFMGRFTWGSQIERLLGLLDGTA
ncbi:MAG TPA: glycosyltransferase family 4 protein [Thalassobaculum sp.]